MKFFLLFLLFVSTLAMAGEKGNGPTPVGDLDQDFKENLEFCCERVFKEQLPSLDTIKINIPGIGEKSYNVQAAEDYCCEYLPDVAGCGFDPHNA